MRIWRAGCTIPRRSSPESLMKLPRPLTDDEVTRARGVPATAPVTSRGPGPFSRNAHGNFGTRPRPGPRAREDRPVELAHHGRSQADRDSLRRDGLHLLPAGRPRGAGDADPAGPARPAPGLARDVQPAVHDARHHHDLPRGDAALGDVLQLPDPAHDRGPGRGVPAAQRDELLGVPGRARSCSTSAGWSTRRPTRGGSATPT